MQGELTARQTYDSNVELAPQDIESEWRSIVSPGFTLLSQTRHNSFSLRYVPSVIYNYRTETDSMDQYVSMLSSYSVEQLHVSLRDTFTMSDTPFEDEDLDLDMSDRRGRNRYITNLARADLRYQLSESTIFTLAYTHHLLDNEDPPYDDYIRQTPRTSLSHIFSPRWQTDVVYRYTYGDFDNSSDLAMHMGDLTLTFKQNPTLEYLAHYTFSSTDYYSIDSDYYIENVTLGIGKTFNPRSSFRLEAGISQLHRDYASLTETPCYNVQYLRGFPKGSIEFLGRGGFDELQFTGSPEHDTLSRYWETRLNLTLQLDINLTSLFYASYHKNRLLERVPVENEALIEAGASLTLAFSRWYSLGLRYIYNLQQADTATREYENNQVMIEFTARKDLARW